MKSPCRRSVAPISTKPAATTANYVNGSRRCYALPKFGPDGTPTLASRDNLAAAYCGAGRTAEAIRLYEQNLKLGKDKRGPDHPVVAVMLARLGLCLLQDKKHAKAEAVLRESLKNLKARQPDAWNTFNTQSMLGGALLGQKKYADAEPLLLKGYEGMKQREDKIPATHRQLRLREALERLVQLYEATGNKDEAVRWRGQFQSTKSSSDKPTP